MATKKKQRTDTTLELTGKVFLVDRQLGKKAVRTEIDGRLVLKLVLRAITEGLALVDQKRTANSGR